MIPIWLQPMEMWKEFRKIRSSFEEELMGLEIVGLSDTQKAHIISSILYADNLKNLLITYSESQAQQLYRDLQGFLGDKVVHLPPKEISYYEIAAKSKEIDAKRLMVLNRLIDDDKVLVVASIEALLFYTTPPKFYKKYIFNLETGDMISPRELIKKLLSMGYERVDEVEGAGQFSQRGGILDVFPLTYENPYRIEFFDIEIDSIRQFDPLSQLSTEQVDTITISPCNEIVISSDITENIIFGIERDLAAYLKRAKALDAKKRGKVEQKIKGIIEKLENHVLDESLDTFYSYIYTEPATVLDYIDGAIFIDEPLRIKYGYDTWRFELHERFKASLDNGEVLPGQLDLYLEYDLFIEKIDRYRKVILRTLPRADRALRPDMVYNISARSVPSYHGKIDMLAEDIKLWKENGYSVLILTGTIQRGERLKTILLEFGVELMISDGQIDKLAPGQAVAIPGSLSSGFEYMDAGLVVVSDREIHGFSRKKRIARKRRRRIDPFTDLKVGDYVVHENHGIGRYLGMEKLDIGGNQSDYLNIQYAGSDTLYISIDQMDTIQPYISTGDSKPRLSKLGGNEWQRTKARARQSAKKLAYSLVELYAARQETKGFKFSATSDWERQFVDMFPYEETDDQLQAIEEIRADMESDRVMDRLLCGDVGYGKTEVAMRAAFKAVMDEKQVALLSPTTILAQQHYNTFVQRFGEFPFNIEVLSRFKTPSEQKSILKKLRRGNVDIIIGTHRLLSEDVKFNDLGLLIVDEEQRFGVGDKEAIKNIKKNVDVLTLTATPIPRTLHMSLVGIRDISIIETPPSNRHPVETYVVGYTPSLIREVIMREIGRGGQVYFVYNKVKTIDWMAGKLSKLMPDIRIAVAHGQMGERRLEKTMMDFYNGKYDVLICSTIIESGLDIPNVNTVIVYDADHFGLSQLYQLRGRVGRSDKRAYAYLTYQKDKVLSEVAEKRLTAIREFTEFGAGFKIAMRDLEIRGTGNLLGPEQHGHMEAVGYDLYCKLLDEEIRSARGAKPVVEIEPTIDIKADAYIDSSYIPHEAHKIEFYKKIASIEDRTDKLDIEDELIDRFGDMPRAAETLIDIAYIKALAKKLGVEELLERDRKVTFKLAKDTKISSKAIMTILNEYRNELEYKKHPISIFILKHGAMPSRQIIKTIQNLLERILELQQE